MGRNAIGLDGDEETARQPDVGRCRSRRGRVRHEARIHLIEPGEVVDVRIEDGRLHQVGQGSPGFAQDGGEVVQGLLGLRLDPLGRQSRQRIDAGRARAEDEPARDDRLAVGAEGGGAASDVTARRPGRAVESISREVRAAAAARLEDQTWPP